MELRITIRLSDTVTPPELHVALRSAAEESAIFINSFGPPRPAETWELNSSVMHCGSLESAKLERVL